MVTQEKVGINYPGVNLALSEEDPCWQGTDILKWAYIPKYLERENYKFTIKV